MDNRWIYRISVLLDFIYVAIKRTINGTGVLSGTDDIDAFDVPADMTVSKTLSLVVNLMAPLINGS